MLTPIAMAAEVARKDRREEASLSLDRAAFKLDTAEVFDLEKARGENASVAKANNGRKYAAVLIISIKYTRCMSRRG